MLPGFLAGGGELVAPFGKGAQREILLGADRALALQHVVAGLDGVDDRRVDVDCRGCLGHGHQPVLELLDLAARGGERFRIDLNRCVGEVADDNTPAFVGDAVDGDDLVAAALHCVRHSAVR